MYTNVPVILSCPAIQPARNTTFLFLKNFLDELNDNGKTALNNNLYCKQEPSTEISGYICTGCHSFFLKTFDAKNDIPSKTEPKVEVQVN